jgi:DNA-binding CsgD family transcriptional regulator
LRPQGIATSCPQRTGRAALQAPFGTSLAALEKQLRHAPPNRSDDDPATARPGTPEPLQTRDRLLGRSIPSVGPKAWGEGSPPANLLEAVLLVLLSILKREWRASVRVPLLIQDMIQGACHMEPICAERLQTLRWLMDGFEEELLLFDSTGKIVLENEAARRSLGSRPSAAQIYRRLGGIAWDMVRPTEELSPKASANHVEAEMVLEDCPRRLRARLLCAWAPRGNRHVLVILHRKAAAHPSIVPLKRRFNLTRQESRVADLLALRRSNKEIARDLEISPHTARHHTQRVLAKLGLTSRKEVASLIGRAAEFDTFGQVRPISGEAEHRFRFSLTQ